LATDWSSKAAALSYFFNSRPYRGSGGSGLGIAITR
jgi:hypothetical protein